MNAPNLYRPSSDFKDFTGFRILEYTVKTGNLLTPGWHEGIELLYFHDGGHSCHIGGSHYNVSADELIVVNSNELRTMTATKRTHYSVILIPPEFFPSKDYEKMKIINHIKKDEFIKDCVLSVNIEKHKSGFITNLKLKSILYSLMAYLYENYATRVKSSSEQTNALVSSLLDYIAKHYFEELTVEELAKMHHFSTGYFCRFFKKHIGKSPVSYINEFRISCALSLISETDEKLSSIATRVGFNDINYFSRIFKKYKKMTPTEYRKSQQIEP